MEVQEEDMDQKSVVEVCREEQERFSKTEFVNKLEDCFLENCLVEPGLVQDCHVLTLEHRVRLCPVTARSEVAADCC
ncbi:hypothetical protein I7I53_09082 [Histoplasma capsulatum var. duboisii H88]|uniref:Uncharacterized protein n=1 Tax=Ajellomyces capsulatus (strain H88) TaxID=544711 RepID=A0A8A1L4L6_AJEC8|nr:hypothetical protein I7I53_09082 [Histoplasma capsulatum var. duboisii H88]